MSNEHPTDKLRQMGEHDLDSGKAVSERAERWMESIRASVDAQSGNKNKRLPRKWFRRPRTLTDRLISLAILACFVIGIGLLLKIPYEYYMRARISNAITAGLDTGNGVVVNLNALPFPGEDGDSSVVQTEPIATTVQTTVSSTAETTEEAPTPVPTPAPTAAPETVTLNAIAKFNIPKIENDAPILYGATEVTLRYGIGWYPPSAPIGEEGRAVLFGHRTRYYYGVYFNRLFELEIGDIIGIVTPEAEYTYRLFKTDVVYKDGVMDEIFQPVEGSQIMLVTCDFRVDPDGNDRYLVHAKLEEVTPRT